MTFNEKAHILARHGYDGSKYDNSVAPPIFQTVMFSYDSEKYGGYVYTSRDNPSFTMVAEKLAAVEGGEAAALFSSGMAAIHAVMFSFLKTGDHVIATDQIYGGTRTLLHKMEAAFGIKTTVVPCDAQAISDALTPETKMIYAESPGSKLFNILDLEAAGQIGRSQRVLRVIDNTWATPMFQNPLAYGFDLVIHSATKFLGGHNDILGGAVIGAKGVIKRLHNLGAVMDPHQAWLLNRSLATLPMRMQRHMESAALIAAFLENHLNVARVFYPGLESHPQYELGRRQMSGYSGLLSFITAGDYDASLQMMKRFRLIKQAWSYGGPTSVAMHNGRYFKASLERMGYPPNLIRLHVGFENPEEIINDLERALNSL